MLRQALEIIRLLGLKRAARIKKRFEAALPHLRGHAVTSCLWTLMKVGLLDEMLEKNAFDIGAYCAEHNLNPAIIEAIAEYLDGLKLVRVEDGKVRMLKRLKELLEEPRGFLELAYAYEPIFCHLEDLARRKCEYGKQVQRHGKYVGRGSGMLCRVLPYPVMADMIRRHGRRCILDLGCGDLAFLVYLCENSSDMTGVGIDVDPPTVEYARQILSQSPWQKRIAVEQADMFRLEPVAERHRDIDCLTAVDTFHEYLIQGEQTIINLLKKLRGEFPQAIFVVGEFCKQPHEKLRKHPTAFLEHHLYHKLSNQEIADADTWLRIFEKAGLRCIEKKVFDIVGHGYFVLS